MEPLQSPTCSRRSALTAMGGSIAAGLTWPAPIRARAGEIPRFSFAVVSDTHLGREDRDDAAKLWTRTARELDEANGDFVLHLGDIVDGGREQQYAVYKDVRKSIRKPVHEIPGNHDRLEHFARHIREAVDTSFDHRGIRFVLMNDCRFGESDGTLTAGQIGWLTRQCDDAVTKGLFIIIAMHVAAHENRLPEAGVRLRDGQKELYAIVDKHRDRVLALLHGHFHCGLRGWSDRGPLHEVVFPSALYNRNLRLTELRAPGFNLPEFRPGFTLIAIGPDGIGLRYKPIGVDAASVKMLPVKRPG